MPKNALANPTVLVALGALLEQPSHAYRLAAILSDQGLPVNRGSLYDTLDAMAAAGWVRAGEPEQSGSRPKRTTYYLTAPGKQELIHRLSAQLRVPRREFPAFWIAVAHVGILGRQGALGALVARLAHIDIWLTEDRQKLDAAIKSGVPRLFVIEAEYALALLTAERGWIHDLINDIKAGHISWPRAQQYHKEVANGKNSNDRA